jgi:hypothetical protein
VWINRQSGNTNAVASTTLNGAITATATTIDVVSTVSLPSQGYIKVDNEVILYQNVSGNQLLNCFRGQNNTTAATHLTAVSVYQIFLPNVNIFPTANAPGNQYTFVYWRLRRVQDGGGGVNTQDIPFRFIPCLVAGLAYYLSLKLPNMDMNRVGGLKIDYEQQFQLAADEDREKASIRFVPRNMFY